MGFANEHQILILLIQDYYHTDEGLFAVPSSHWKVYESSNQMAAVVVTRGDIEVVESYCDGNSIFVNITTSTGKVTVGSTYSRPKADLRKDMAWLDYFDPLHHLILGADLNVHLSLLGYQNEDERGALLTHILLSKNLILLNDSESPETFIGQPLRPCKGNPDVTLCTQDLAVDVDSWYVNGSRDTI